MKGRTDLRIQDAPVAGPGIRPTMVIGLGGTGHRVVAHLKAILLQAYGEEWSELIRLLVFDTADESIIVHLGDTPVALEMGSELFNIGNTPVPKIIQNIDRQPAIKARMPGIQNLPPVALRAGAKQLRPLGLLALLWRYDEVEQRIKDVIWALAGKDTLTADAPVRLGQSQGINAFICNSLVGGTGSGTFIDVAYLVRSIFNELGTLGDFCYVTGVGVLPQAFNDVDGPNIIPNTVAALRELQRCMVEGGFTCQYPNGRVIEAHYPPFNSYYLVDGVDELGHTWRGLADLCPMIAQGLFLQIGSQVGRKGENEFDNVDEVLTGVTETGEGTFCGSFGLARLRFSAERAVQLCALRFARSLVEDGLLRQAEEETVCREVVTFVKGAGLEAGALVELLARDDQGLPIAVSLAAPAWLRALKDQTAPQETIRYARDYQRVRLEGDFCRWIEGQAGAARGCLEDDLRRKVTVALADPALGIDYALRLARALAKELRGLGGALAARRERWEVERTRLERDIVEREESLLRSPAAPFFLRSRSISTAQRRYLETCQALFQAALHCRLADTAGTLLAGLQQEVEGLEREVNALVQKLGSAQRLLADREAALWIEAGLIDFATLELATSSYIEVLYREQDADIGQALGELAQGGRPHLWLDKGCQEIADDLLMYARLPFAALARLSVEEVIEARRDETSPAARLEALLTLATPSWNLDRTRLADGGAHLKLISVLGVADERHSLYRDSTRMLASTGDSSRITAFIATMGAPFSALQQYPTYERIYERARRIRPLHVIAEFQSDSDQARLAFALGSVLGFIFSRGFYFYYRPSDSLERPIKLDNGLANAVRCFGATDSLVKETLERVESHIEKVGTDATLRALAAYYERPAEEEGTQPADGLILEMRKLVRAYAEELRRTQRLASGG